MAQWYDVLVSFSKTLIDNGNGTFSLRTNGGSITPGTTTISGGTDTRVLFDDGGVVGEDGGFTYDKTTDSLTVGQLVAYKSSSPAYVYAFNTTLSKYTRTWADANYGYLDSNTDIVITAGTGNNVIVLNTIAQTDVVQTGTTPETGWLVQTATSSISTGPMSMIQMNLGKDYTASLSNNGLFLDITGDHNTGVHINIASGASKSAGLIQGIHDTNGVGQFIDLDGSSAYFQRLYQNVTGSQTIFDWHLNENYPTTDYTGTGTLSGTTFTGNVINLQKDQVTNFSLKHNGAVWIDQQVPYFSTSDSMFSVKHSITSIGTSASPLDIIKLPAPVYTLVSPSANTNSGLGITLYSSLGSNLELYGSNNYNGGLSLGMFQSGAVSGIALFGGTTNFSSGTVDGSTGLYFNGVHSGNGSAQTNLYGLIVEAYSDDAANPGSPTGSVTNAIAGLFSVGAGGANVTTGASIKANEPAVFDALQGYGANATLTDKTAVWINGTASITVSDVATAASITNMTVATSFVRMTGSTATNIHGIHADSFAKVLIIYNASSATVTLNHQSATDGTAANRIICNTGANVAIAAGKSATLHYDTSQSRWVHLINS